MHRRSLIYILLGVVEYQFYRTFPADKRAIVMQAMEYITNNSCIRFQPKIGSTVDYVNINYGADCHSDVGRVGGMQTLNLNRSIIKIEITRYHIKLFQSLFRLWHYDSCPRVAPHSRLRARAHEA